MHESLKQRLMHIRSSVSRFYFIGLGHAQVRQAIESGTPDVDFDLLPIPFTRL